MATKVKGDLYEGLDAKLFEIKRQIRQHDGYPYDPNSLDTFLQRAIEGDFRGPACLWREENGVIYFTVTSDGTTGEEWIKRLESKGFRLSDYAKSVLRSKDFKPTKGKVYKIAVLKGGELFFDENRITSNIRKEALHRKMEKPNAEVACLIREMLSDKELEKMGLIWIVTMHEPIKDSDGDLLLLDTDRNDDGSWLDTDYDHPGNRWHRENGFAFVVSQ